MADLHVAVELVEMRSVRPHRLVRRCAREIGEAPDPAVVLGSCEEVGREKAGETYKFSYSSAQSDQSRTNTA